ncbi:hypothetical protein QOZ80_8BG0641760 [Eleusine coracana subsp. coracana]|nr:hypothetical protein QOZ80_8BG0641760 [Eleusine coracana subsp. coracana]
MRTAVMQQPQPLCCRRNQAASSSSSLSFAISYGYDYERKKKKQQWWSSAIRAAASDSSTKRSDGKEEEQKVLRLTLSDAELASRGFSVRRTAEGLDVGALNEVFARVGFPRRQEERLRRALDHSRVVWLSSSSESVPVAFARAAGDGVFNAVVWDVVVEPSCQGLGLGRAVMERLVLDLRRDGVANIVLYAEPRVVGFYRLLDFAMDPDGIRGMAYYYRKSSSTTTN